MPSVANRAIHLLWPGLAVAALFGVGAALLAAPSFSPAPRVPSPGTLSISAEASPGQEAPQIDVRVRMQPSSTETLSTIVVTNESRPDNERQSFVPLILTLCGAVRDSSLEQINRARLELAPLATTGVFSSGLGDWRDCVYTRISQPSSVMSTIRPNAWQVIVSVKSNVVTYRQAGDRVRAVLPNLISEPLPVAVPHAAALGPGSSAKLVAIGLPTDLTDVIASPGLPDPGLLEWTPKLTGPAYPGGFRLTATRDDVRASQGAMLFIAGVLAGLAGSALLWAIDRTRTPDMPSGGLSEQKVVDIKDGARKQNRPRSRATWAIATAALIWLCAASRRRHGRHATDTSTQTQTSA